MENIEVTMLAGELYDPTHPDLVALRQKAHALCKAYNDTLETEVEKRQKLLQELIGHMGEDVMLQGPIQIDYGGHTHMGSRVMANFNLTILDSCMVIIGDDVMIGPNCTLATPLHPMVASERKVHWRKDGSLYNLEYGKQIILRDGCWLASNVTVCAGVTIGEGSVIGAGSVVTEDIPRDSFAVGNPCRVKRHISKDESICGNRFDI